MLQVVGYLLQFFLDGRHVFIGLFGIETRNPLDFDFGEPDDVVAGYLPLQFRLKGFQSVINRLNNGFKSLTFFNALVNLILDEYFLQGGVVPGLFQLIATDFQLAGEQVHRMIGVGP